MLRVCKSLDNETVELVKKSKEKNDTSFVMKSNDIKEKVKRRNFVSRRSNCSYSRKKRKLQGRV